MTRTSIALAIIFAALDASAADLSNIPQINETKEQRDERMQWFRDAKFGMFIHWGPCSVGRKEIGWGRDGNRPWDINKHGPRTSDPVYDNYYKQFNPTNYNADEWVKFAKASGMKYMVIITKHHDGVANHARLFSGERAAQGYAFHTGDETNPWAKIDLGAVKTVKAVVIENRPGERRTDGLILSVSEDGKKWEQVWSAKKWEQRWLVPITRFHSGVDVSGRPARYLKVETKGDMPRPMLLQRFTVCGDE